MIAGILSWSYSGVVAFTIVHLSYCSANKRKRAPGLDRGGCRFVIHVVYTLCCVRVVSKGLYCLFCTVIKEFKFLSKFRCHVAHL